MIKIINTFEDFLKARKAASDTVAFYNCRSLGEAISKWKGPPGLIQHTRGTTSGAKFVHVPWSAINARSSNFAALRDPSAYKRVLALGKPISSYYLCAAYYGPHDLGAETFPLPEDGDVGNVIDELQITVLPLIPTEIASLVKRHSRPLKGTLELITCGSAELSEADHAALSEWSGGVPIITGYGTTETGVMSMTEGTPDGPKHVGKFLSGLRVSDGLIEVRGPSLASRYISPHQTTLGASLPLNAGWFRTSDRASIVNNQLYFHGRKE